ncbi:hypothetical protein HaLaN_13948 [Haematococcus lacustris]|uniref:Uncharacterized protein n=1 Tax=Haematococcus lacustris TaxID=44745 RepID=A0A699Z6Y2_HAELA|nr:hypothetical protein HaLaN_13948 [Haematococcus lacustris]
MQQARQHNKVATVDEFRTSRVSSAVNSPQLNRSKPTRAFRLEALKTWNPGASGARRQCKASCDAHD